MMKMAHAPDPKDCPDTMTAVDTKSKENSSPKQGTTMTVSTTATITSGTNTDDTEQKGDDSIYDDHEDADFEDCELDDDGWGDDEELVFDEQKAMEIQDPDALDREMESQRLNRQRAKQKIDAFWKCGGCQFLFRISIHSLPFICWICHFAMFHMNLSRNHPLRTSCMMCHISRTDEIHLV